MANNYLNLIENNHSSIYEANGNNKPWVSYNKENKNVYYNHSPEYVEIGGIKWATKCIGASSPYSYDAWLFQWGDMSDHSKDSGNTTSYAYNWANTPYNGGNSSYNESVWTTMSGNVLDTNSRLKYEYDPASQLRKTTPLEGYHWRMPTHEEMTILMNYKLTLSDTTVKGCDGSEIILNSSPGLGEINSVNGMCYGKTTESVTDVLFLPFRGHGYWYEIANYGTRFSTWCSDIYTASPSQAYHFNCTASFQGVGPQERYYGLSILPVLTKD